MIIARIPPIRTIPDTYQEQAGKQLHEEVPQEKGILNYALEISCKRAEGFNAKGVLASGMEVVMGMVFDLIPIVIAWGTIALVIATYTPVFNWISYPMGLKTDRVTSQSAPHRGTQDTMPSIRQAVRTLMSVYTLNRVLERWIIAE